ncbi:hypothetical protein [Pseudomonas sp. NPDC079086]|uniref:hypothetical protein n=1 Tax=unclassified Pseudomonas TaxID=196821 RepID=UPI0037C8D8FC
MTMFSPLARPLAFGWPWHGLIRKSEAGTTELILNSGGVKALDEDAFGGPETYLFDADMPLPDIPSPPEHDYWNVGIRRGYEGSMIWGGVGVFKGCVIGGKPYPEEIEVFGSSTEALTVIVRRRVEGVWLTVDQKTITLTGLGVDTSRLWPEGTPSFWGFQYGKIDCSKLGDKWLYALKVVDNRDGYPKQIAIVELAYNPITETVSVHVVADFEQCFVGSLVNEQDSIEPQQWRRYSVGGMPVDVREGDPPPSGVPEHDYIGYTLGDYTASYEIERVIHAWYSADGSVRLIKLAKRSTTRRNLITMEYKELSERREWWLDGIKAHDFLFEQSVEYIPVGDATGSWYSRTITTELINGTASEPVTVDLPDGLVREYLLGPLVAISRTAYPIPQLVMDDDRRHTFIYRRSVTVLRLCNKMLALLSTSVFGDALYGALDGGPSFLYPGTRVVLEQAQAIHPDGVDEARHSREYSNGVAIPFGWFSGSHNPVTGETIRAVPGFIHTWV